MTGRDALMQLRRLFTAGNWCRYKMHRKWAGKDYYCFVGGLRHVTGLDFQGEAIHLDAFHEAQSAFVKAIGGRDPMNFNDNQESVDAVIEKIDEAVLILDHQATAS
jgi:hypothetical protein